MRKDVFICGVKIQCGGNHYCTLRPQHVYQSNNLFLAYVLFVGYVSTESLD